MTSKFTRALLATTCVLSMSGAGIQSSLAAAAPTVPVVADGIGGVVTGAKGPEAGVWVIAETHDLPTRLIKIVVTDDQGRFMLPELPKAKYDLWVRGYGLVDSKRVDGTPGKNVTLTAVPAPDAKAAAEYYPANYWFALITPPAASEFPGTGPKGNGISPGMKTQQDWLAAMKDGCVQCHQQGDKTTRTLMDSMPEGWAERIKRARENGDQVLGDHGKDFSRAMQNTMTMYGRARALSMWADWTSRIQKGAFPPEAPPRPQGVERNLVLTSWDWANGRYVHDNVSTDRHDPKVNANGPIYGVIGMAGYIEILDPVTGKQDELGYKVTANKKVEILPPNQRPDAFPHNPMLDRHGRLWITDLGRYGAPLPDSAPPDKMPYCTDPANKFAKYFPQPGKTTNTLLLFDPKKRDIEGITMCNGMHHLMFAPDQKNLYLSGGDGQVVSWVDIDKWDSTHDPVKSMSWCPMVLDTNATKTGTAPAADEVSITPDYKSWNTPVQPGFIGGGEEIASGEAAKSGPPPLDMKKDTRIAGFLYGIDADIHDNSMWLYKFLPLVPGGVVRFEPGSNPPETCHTEYYEAPKQPDGKNYQAFDGRSVSVDSKGVAWIAYGSGQFGRFERGRCKVLRGPNAIGQHCPEGWSFFDSPGPKFAGVNAGSTDYHYYNWVDLHDTLGLGKDTPLFAGSNSDAIFAIDQKTQKILTLRVPYPMAFHTRGMDGRFDDPSKGWKGKGLFATYASEPVWHQEGGDDGTTGPQLVKFQMRPDPLAY